MKFVDPDGAWSWLASAAGFVYGYVSHGITEKEWGWEALAQGGLSGLMWGLGYGKMEMSEWSYVAKSIVANTANSFMPSANIPVNDHFSVSASVGFGVGTTGIAPTGNFSGSVSYGDFQLSAGIGHSSNPEIGDIFGFRGRYSGFSYGLTQYSGGNDPQWTGSVGINKGKFSLMVENDMFVWNDKDRGRTSAVEIGIGKFKVGTYVYTNDGEDESGRQGEGTDHNGTSRLWGKNRYPYGAWKEGFVYSAPLYIEYTSKSGNITRMGYSHRSIEDATQNFIHKYVSGTNFFTNYSKMYQGTYAYRGPRSQFSIFY